MTCENCPELEIERGLHRVTIGRWREAEAKLKTAINIIKYAQRRGFEWPADPMETIEAAGRATSVCEAETDDG